MLYICKDCRETFVDPATEREDCGWETDLGHISAYQNYYVCPNCGSEDIDEEDICVICGESFAKDEMDYNIDGDLVCEKCLSSISIYINEEGDNE